MGEKYDRMFFSHLLTSFKYVVRVGEMFLHLADSFYIYTLSADATIYLKFRPVRHKRIQRTVRHLAVFPAINIVGITLAALGNNRLIPG